MANNTHIFENEKWWQEHGGEWGDVVWRRKAKQPLYGIQEVILSSYFSGIPKSRVMEFGFGFGRHIDYLNLLPNIEIYGVDQSPTMIENMKLRVGQDAEFLKRIVQISPRQRLPFPDGYFDVVYTVSVLIHVRPEHLDDILRELARVSRHGIIHFENNYTETTIMTSTDHDGCWAHTLVDAYRRIGLNAEVLQKAALEQDVYFVKLSSDDRYDYNVSPVISTRLKELDGRILPHMRFVEGEIGWMKAELAERQSLEEQLRNTLQELQNINARMQNEINETRLRSADLRQQNDTLLVRIDDYNETLNEIYSSLAWKIVTKLRKSKGFYSLTKQIRGLVKAPQVLRSPDSSHAQKPVDMESDNIREFIEQLHRVKQSAGHVAIHHPDWLGVSNATRDLFQDTIGLREIHHDAQADYVAHQILAKGFRTVVFSGLADGHAMVMRRLRELDPQLRILLYWHGNTTHMYEDYSWLRHEEIIDLHNSGVINTWGFAKREMSELYAARGFRTAFVMNFVPFADLHQETNVKPGKNTRIGLYASGSTWNKNVYTQIAAASLLDNVDVRATPCSDRMRYFAKHLGVNLSGVDRTISRGDLHSEMRQNDLNLYVTFSECAPLLPLESLSLGVPCLTGPNHHYFMGSPLEQYLVVNRPDDPTEIARMAKRALEEADRIIEMYADWVTDYMQKAQRSVHDFLGE